MEHPELQAATRSLDSWLRTAALPLWATRGFDAEHGRFEERLDFDGRPVADVPRRVMVQARQIHVYALAARRGWHSDALRVVEQGFEALQRSYHRRDGRDGWVFSLTREGDIADSSRDLYAHAFILLAIASYVLATGKRSALALATETLSFLDREMRGAAGGYIESLPARRGPRRQNPHMHLFEAMLALWACSGDRDYLTRADMLFGLLETHFFQVREGIVLEYFDDFLRPADGKLGDLVEPGHHFEWCWLLRTYDQATGGRSGAAIVDALYAHADRYGRDDDGLIVDELLPDGSVRTPSRRLWPMAEGIRCNLVEASLERPGALEKAVTMAGLLHARFLDRRGIWTDRLDAQGRPVGDFVPASSLYHLVGAIDELHAIGK